MNPADVTELIDRYNTAWNEQDLDTIHALHHPEIVFDNHSPGERAEGADAVRAHIAAIFANNPDMKFTSRSFQAGDDFAVCEWTLTVTKDGRRLEWDGVDVFPIRDDLIVRKDVYSTSHRARELPG
jgi:ketosteroid isomerase-like protein